MPDRERNNIVYQSAFHCVKGSHAKFFFHGALRSHKMYGLSGTGGRVG